jgi:hypothetical protein
MDYTDHLMYRAACWDRLFVHKARLTTSHRQADPGMRLSYLLTLN